MKMNYVRSLCAATLLAFAAQANAALIISEILDGDLSGGLPKFVELTNTSGAPIDLSGYSIGNFNNGGTTLGGGASSVLSGILSAGDSYVIGYENGDPDATFATVYGFAPDKQDLGSFINGDDAVALFLSDGTGTDGAATGDGSDATLVDVYGVIGVNGDNEVWDYTDSYAFRNADVTSPNATFTPSEWTFAGRSALDGEDAAGHAAVTTPGTHEVIPEPASFLLVAMGLIALGATRMRRTLG